MVFSGKKTLKAIGFTAKWFSWKMETVRTVEYSVLIKGNPQIHIKPQQGLRKGDALPYLYTICTYVLSHSIDVNTSAGRIRGIHIGNGIPLIT